MKQESRIMGKNKMIRKIGGIFALLSLITLVATPLLSTPSHAAAGDLDLTFGSGGKTLFQVNTILNPSKALAIQPDGKIIIAGGNGYQYGLARFNPDGNADTTFGSNGFVTTDFPGSGEHINSIALQQDGKILVAGGGQGFMLARYNQNGSLDPSFGTGGKVVSSFVNREADSVAIQNDGRVVVAGSTAISPYTQMAVVRYNSNGSLDNSFGNNGSVIVAPISYSYDTARKIIIQNDGKIMIGGTALIRLNNNGSLDSTFDNDGKIESTNIWDMLIQPDGKLVYMSSNFGIARVNTDGTFESGFGIGGGINFGGVIANSTSIVMLSDGKFIVGGRYQSTANSENLFALARYNSNNGSLDTTFGNNGKIITPSFYSTPNAYNLLNDLAIQADGKLIAGGQVNEFNGTNPSGILVRYEMVSNQPPIANAGLDQTVNEGSSVSFDGSGSTDPDGNGDIVSYEWDFGDGATGSGTVVIHTYTDNGVYTATLTVTDTAGATSTDSAIITINNIAPTVGEITAPLVPQQVNMSISASANFSDPGVLDTHIAIWAWGDGSTSAGTVSEVNGSGSVTGNHTYTLPGVYALTLTVTDKDGASGTSTFRYIVIYDPSGGFVTGGGWIDSPAGAYTANPALAGKANFGFNSKYQSGTTIPTGQTQFNFKVANLNFHGNVYDWLVVSGPKAQFKGSGTINSSGDYGFILTANDGAVSGGGGVDKFRLKVWDKATGNIVYDNQLGDNDDANASTAIGAGNIIIHN